jgi:hypothetical protein
MLFEGKVSAENQNLLAECREWARRSHHLRYEYVHRILWNGFLFSSLLIRVFTGSVG